MEFFAALQADLQSWYDERGLLVIILQMGLLAVAGVIAWFVHRHLQKHIGDRLDTAGMSVFRSTLLEFGQRLAFPLSALLAVVSGRLVMQLYGYSTPILGTLAQLLVALAIIRIIVYGLRVGIAPGPALKAWEQIISTGIWAMVALHLLGLLQPAMDALDALAFNFGDTRVSALLTLKVIILSALYILLALWVAGLVDSQLQKSQHINASMKVGLSKVNKVLLLTVAILAALTEAGLNLSSLTIFGGALGVGLGFGLQKIVSNFISGFILLGDRSIKPGDIITVGDNFGWVRELRARYIVVRNRDGVETLIPNENLVTTDVINWSYSDRKVRLRIPVQVSYDDDPEQAMQLMEEAAQECSRVLKDPAPACRLIEFADSGIALELRVWFTDPQQGVGNIRSEVNVAIWRAFKKAGITIPYPQRDVHLRQVESISGQQA
jgi:small-conductance mechanosensitive channel